MAEVRLLLGSGAGGLWTAATSHVLLRVVSSKRRACVSAVTQEAHSCSVLSRSCVNISRSYKTSSIEEIPLYRSKSAYYDILQVSPSATQAQIKTAYYKQSFIYHPDKNSGSEYAALRFSQISEAYNVLGNKSLRKKYDRGVLSEADIQAPSRATVSKDTASRDSGGTVRNRPSAQSNSGEQDVFKFDAFYRAHYGEQLQRQKQIRARLQDLQRHKEEKFQDQKLSRLSEVAIGIMLTVAAAIMFTMKS